MLALLPLLWRLGSIVALVLSVWWGWSHFIETPYVERGRAEEHTKTAAAESRALDAEKANTRFKDDYAQLQLRYNDQTTKVQALEKQTADAKAASKKALAAVAKLQAESDKEISRLRDIANAPLVLNNDQDCKEAGKLLDGIDERLRSRNTVN